MRSIFFYTSSFEKFPDINTIKPNFYRNILHFISFGKHVHLESFCETPVFRRIIEDELIFQICISRISYGTFWRKPRKSMTYPRISSLNTRTQWYEWDSIASMACENNLSLFLSASSVRLEQGWSLAAIGNGQVSVISCRKGQNLD